MVSGVRIFKSWRASSSCSLVTPIKEFSRNAGRPPTPSRKVYRGTRTRPKTCEGEETQQDSSHYNKLFLEQKDTPAEQVLRLHTSVTSSGPNCVQASAQRHVRFISRLIFPTALSGFCGLNSGKSRCRYSLARQWFCTSCVGLTRELKKTSNLPAFLLLLPYQGS